MQHKLNPPTKLYTQKEMWAILRKEIVHHLIPYNLTHSELKEIIKQLKKKYT
jgi:hypothetical protein